MSSFGAVRVVFRIVTCGLWALAWFLGVYLHLILRISAWVRGRVFMSYPGGLRRNDSPMYYFFQNT